MRIKYGSNCFFHNKEVCSLDGLYDERGESGGGPSSSRSGVRKLCLGETRPLMLLALELVLCLEKQIASD